MSTLEEQLAEVFSRGLDNDPELRASLEEALSSSLISDKSTRAEANYREAEDERSCDTCTHYNSDEHSCDIVSGYINPGYVSDYYEPVDEEA